MDNNNLNQRDFAPPPSTDFELPPESRFKKEISPLSKNVATLLALFLGSYGIHYFYLGDTKKGLIRLILTLLVITSPISSIMAFVDFWKLLMANEFCDGQGRVLQ